MDLTDGMKEVDYDSYCKTCQNKDTKEEEQPCYDCLAEPVNQYSHKPVRYEQKKNAR